MVPRETVLFVSGNIRTRGKTKLTSFPIKCFVMYLAFLIEKTNKDGVWATTAQLYPSRDIFEFDQGRVTKNQPLTVLILLSECLAI